MSKEIHAEVLAIADFAQPKLVVDGKAGSITPPEDLYVQLATNAGLDVEQVRKVSTFNRNFSAGITLAFGRAANELADKHKEVKTIDFTIPTIDKGSFSTSWERTREVPTGIGKDAGTRTAHGYIGPRNWSTGFGAKSGQMSTVLGLISEEAQNLFNAVEA